MAAELTSKLFFPQRDCEPVPAKNVFSVSCRDGCVLRCCRLSNQAGGGKTLLHFHGNGELASKLCLNSQIEGIPNFRDCLDWLLARGRLGACVLVEYRGYGANHAIGPPTVANMLSDAEDVMEACSSADEEMIVMGRSIGTIPALHLASLHPKLFALVVESGMADALQFIEDKMDEATDHFESTPVGRTIREQPTFLRNFPGAVLMLHCADEEIFPFEEHGKQNYCLACGEDAVEESWTSLTGSADYSLTKLCTENGQSCTLHKYNRLQGVRALKALCEFELGGHNYVWPVNWKAYSCCMDHLLQGTLNHELGEHEADGSWWTRRNAKANSKPRCLIS